MPEFPEVKIYCKNLNKLLAGAKAEQVYPASFSQLAGRTLERIESSGKESFFFFDGELILSVHLMLTGEYGFSEKGGENLVPDALFVLKTDRGTLSVSDANGYAKVKFAEALPLAPEPLSQNFTLQYLLSVLTGKRAVKTVLTDQAVIRGIGNAYADEILYCARIHPLSKAKTLPSGKAEKLFDAINSVMETAIGYLEKNRPDIISGEDRPFLKVHRRKTTDEGESVEMIRAGGRKTYFTASQILYE